MRPKWRRREPGININTTGWYGWIVLRIKKPELLWDRRTGLWDRIGCIHRRPVFRFKFIIVRWCCWNYQCFFQWDLPWYYYRERKTDWPLKYICEKYENGRVIQTGVVYNWPDRKFEIECIG